MAARSDAAVAAAFGRASSVHLRGMSSSRALDDASREALRKRRARHRAAAGTLRAAVAKCGGSRPCLVCGRRSPPPPIPSADVTGEGHYLTRAPLTRGIDTSPGLRPPEASPPHPAVSTRLMAAPRVWSPVTSLWLDSIWWHAFGHAPAPLNRPPTSAGSRRKVGALRTPSVVRVLSRRRRGSSGRRPSGPREPQAGSSHPTSPHGGLGVRWPAGFLAPFGRTQPGAEHLQ